MTQVLSPFAAVAGLDGVYTAEAKNLRCVAIRLRSGNLCLYSPVQGLGDAARASLDALGTVSHLLAPNHYHNKAVTEYAAAFPEAVLCCSDAARPRLEAQTGCTFVPLQSADMHLPDGATLATPVGLKTGEVWIDVESGPQRCWILTDAFCGPKTTKGAFADRPALLGTFPTYGIGDLPAYLDWLRSFAHTAAPTMIVPCHGSIVSGTDLRPSAVGLVADLLQAGIKA